MQLPRSTHLVVLCREGTEHPMQMLRRILERLELTLNETKTRIVKAFDDEFKFPGFSIWMGGKRQENGEALSPGPTFKEIPASHQRPGYPSYDKKSDDYAT